MRHLRHLLPFLALLLALSPAPGAGVRVKDLVIVSGADANHLVGYGLVTGLANDGDKNPIYTVQPLANMLQRFGVSVPASTLQSKNIAAVMVTAEIPAFKKPGTLIDVHVSSIGDAKSLQGGTLLQTPLFGADNQMYAEAQGALAIGGFVGGTGGAGGATVQRNHPTVGQIVNGGKVTREIPATIVHDNELELLLRESDYTSSARLAEAINQVFTNSCSAIDATSVRVRVPAKFQASPIQFLSRVEAIEMTPDVAARVIIYERTGTIVANSRIQIGPCAISHGNLTINIASTLDVSQPNPLSQTGATVVTPRTDTKVSESKASFIVLPEMPTVEKVASSLNSLGVTPRDMMSIFLAMKQAGALQAELLSR